MRGVVSQCIRVNCNCMMDWQLLHPTLEPLTSESIAQLCASLNLDSTFLDLEISRPDCQKRPENVVPTPYEGPEELAVREAANRRLEAVLREHGVHLPPSSMFPISMRLRHFRLQLRSLGLPDEKVQHLVLHFKSKKHSMLTLLWRTRQRLRARNNVV